MNRRSYASRFFRLTMRPAVRAMAVVLVASGWALMLVAGRDQVLPSAPSDPNWTAVGAGALLFMGIFAGISRWVADPAAQKMMSKHVGLGVAAHPEFLSRLEWEDNHSELLVRLGEMSGDIKVLLERTKRTEEAREQ